MGIAIFDSFFYNVFVYYTTKENLHEIRFYFHS